MATSAAAIATFYRDNAENLVSSVLNDKHPVRSLGINDDCIVGGIVSVTRKDEDGMFSLILEENLADKERRAMFRDEVISWSGNETKAQRKEMIDEAIREDVEDGLKGDNAFYTESDEVDSKKFWAITVTDVFGEETTYHVWGTDDSELERVVSECLLESIIPPKSQSQSQKRKATDEADDDDDDDDTDGKKKRKVTN
jgi:hypothetical protein